MDEWFEIQVIECRDYDSGYLLEPKCSGEMGNGKWEDYFNKDPCKEIHKWVNQSRNYLWIRCESSSEEQD